MSSLLRWMVLTGVVLGLGLAFGEGPPALAQPQLKKRIDDQAGLFSEQAVGKAREEVAAISRQTKHELFVQTVEHPPAQYKGKDAKDYASRWAEQNFETYGVNGVYVLICKEPHILRVVAGNQTLQSGAF